MKKINRKNKIIMIASTVNESCLKRPDYITCTSTST